MSPDRQSSLLLAIGMVALTSGASVAAAQCEGAWEASQADEAIAALQTWDHDRDPSTPDLLIAGGPFKSIGGVTAYNIAYVNESGWHPLGGGVGTATSGAVWTLCVYKGDLIAAGGFYAAGGVSVRHIAKCTWNAGTFSWSELRGTLGEGANSTIWALTVMDEKLFVGGTFTEAGGRTIRRVTSWNGSDWSDDDELYDLGEADLKDCHSVKALKGFNGKLVAGTTFGDHLFVLDPHWTPLDGGTNGNVQVLAVYQGDLIVGGPIHQFGSASEFAWLARWDGSGWEGFGTLYGSVGALHVMGDDLYAAASVSWPATTQIAWWDGSAWHELREGVDAPVGAIAAHNGKIYAGGTFTQAGRCSSSHLAIWNPESADLNGDCLVDFSDYLVFLDDFDAGWACADLNRDGIVDFLDYLEFLNRYGA